MLLKNCVSMLFFFCSVKKNLTSVMHSRYDYDTTYNTKFKKKKTTTENKTKSMCAEHGTRDSRLQHLVIMTKMLSCIDISRNLRVLLIFMHRVRHTIFSSSVSFASFDAMF